MKRIVSRILVATLLITGCALPAPAANHDGGTYPGISVFSAEAPRSAVQVHKDVITLSEMGEMNDEQVDKTIGELNEANKQHPKKIVLVINSPGGSVPAGWKLIKAIESSPTPVTCMVDGDAASMAFATLQSCKERVMTRRSALMAHQLSMGGMLHGQPEKWANVSKMLRVMEAALDWQCSRRLKISLEEYKKQIDGGREFWMTPDEALEIGAVDRIIVYANEV